MKFKALFFRLALLALAYVGLFYPIGGTFRLGDVLDPYEGAWGTARSATKPVSGDLKLDAMESSVRVEFDDRGVPHIFADSDRDAIIAMGYVVTRDRLFQMDFIHRAATGTLSELLGASALNTDRFFRKNGISDAVHRNTELLASKLPREAETVSWYAAGADAYLESLTPSQVPLEYKLLDAQPPRQFETSFTMALFSFMTYDLSFQNQDVRLEALKLALGEIDFNVLYPEFGRYEKTIIQPGEEHWTALAADAPQVEQTSGDQSLASSPLFSITDRVLPPEAEFNPPPFHAEGFLEGKGSNNWAVDGSRSSTGMPILAGDMHLGLSLPAIWYEAHLVTPTANVYGVTFPSVPGIVEGITPTMAWAFTNTGSDQLDTYAMELNEGRDAYMFNLEWRPLEVITDTILVKNADPVIETRLQSHLGPIIEGSEGDYAIKWVGHEFGKTFHAVWDMNRATDYPSFEKAIRNWDYPMQNILYAGRDSIIAIRSTGYLPIRAQGHAFGVQDGTTSRTEWIGRVPFEELPHAVSPQRGFLTSTNQRLVPEGYPYYLDQDWRSVYRSMRIFELLDGSDKHSPEDIRSYQADVKSMQAILFLPFIQELDGLTAPGVKVRDELAGFDGQMSLESTSARLFDWFMDALLKLTWDEDAFRNGMAPKDIRILELTDSGNERWFDRQATPEVETFRDILRQAVNAAGEQWEKEDYALIPWGETQNLVVRHITRSEALKPLWRGPYPYPGYQETLSPASANPVYYSASWRVTVDFSSTPPEAFGVYPGGQSGNPFSQNYADHLGKYVAFEYYKLNLSGDPASINP